MRENRHSPNGRNGSNADTRLMTGMGGELTVATARLKQRNLSRTKVQVYPYTKAARGREMFKEASSACLRQAWKNWWKADYSWNGLAKKQHTIWAHNFPWSSLQQYWRRDPSTGQLRNDAALIAAGELIECEGTTFHIVHLPPQLPSGATTWKEDVGAPEWEVLEAITAKRVDAATGKVSHWYGRDDRAQLRGAVLRRAIQHPSGSEHALHAIFKNSIFIDSVDWGGSEFGPTCSFDGVTFLEIAEFNNTIFLGEAWFKEVEFCHMVWFNNARFCGNVDFQKSKFRHQTQFNRSVFEQDVKFKYTTFEDLAIFEDTTFSSYAEFGNATFKSEFHFGGATFNRAASFESVTLPDEARNWHGAFKNTRFLAPLILTDAKSQGQQTSAPAAFDGASLEAGIVLDLVTDDCADRRFKIEVEQACAAAQWDEPVGKLQAAGTSTLRDRRLAQLERGCRVLKQAMDKASNKSAEQRFHRYELIARRGQRSTPLSERSFSRLYEWSANYGASLSRPIASLFAIWLVFAVTFWLIDDGLSVGGLHSRESVAISSLSFSLSRILPSGAFENVSSDWIARFAGAHSPTLVLFVRFLASLESILAVILAFMFGFAVKRKFQII